MTGFQDKPGIHDFQLADVSEDYSWYWRNEAWYFPLWEWGSNVIENHGLGRTGLVSGGVGGVLGANVGWGYRAYGWGLEFPGAADGNFVNFGRIHPLARDVGNPWTVWAAFQADDVGVDDRTLWSKSGGGNNQQLQIRVDRDTSPPSRIEVRTGGVDRVSGSAGDFIEPNVPYLVVVSQSPGLDFKLWTVDLLTQQILDDGVTGTGTSGHTTSVDNVLGARDNDADDMDGVIYAAGIIDNFEMAREHVELLARDIYGPARIARKMPFNALAVAITDGEIAAATGPKRHDVDLPPAEVVAY